MTLKINYTNNRGGSQNKKKQQKKTNYHYHIKITKCQQILIVVKILKTILKIF